MQFAVKDGYLVPQKMRHVLCPKTGICWWCGKAPSDKDEECIELSVAELRAQTKIKNKRAIDLIDGWNNQELSVNELKEQNASLSTTMRALSPSLDKSFSAILERDFCNLQS